MSDRGESDRSPRDWLVGGLALLSAALAIAVAMLWLKLARAGAPAASAPSEAAESDALLLEPATFDDLPGWNDDPLDGVAEALGRSCGVAAAKAAADWSAVCARVAGARDASELRQVLTAELRPWSMRDRAGDQGLLTGYYEPLLHGARRRSDRFTVPLHVRPPELVDIDLGAFREDLAGKRLAGVVRGTQLVPFADRAGVEGGALDGRGLELLWVDDPIDAFFLHIQGSGRVALEDGTEVRVGYAAQNGHPYVAIGRELVARGALALGDVTMQSIRAWLEAHPDQAADVMRSNPSYVFFRKLEGTGPVGSQGVELEPYRSIAVDTRFVRLGVPMWIAGTWPSALAGEPDRALERLLIAQDTGGAIRGPLRADLFCGHGDEAAEIAGRLKHPFRGWVLLPRVVEPR